MLTKVKFKKKNPLCCLLRLQIRVSILTSIYLLFLFFSHAPNAKQTNQPHYVLSTYPQQRQAPLAQTSCKLSILLISLHVRVFYSKNHKNHNTSPTHTMIPAVICCFTCRDATLFIWTARPTPQESFSRAGSYRPTRLVGSVLGPARGLPPLLALLGRRAALAAASSAFALAAREDCRDVMSTALLLLLLPGSGRRTPPPTVARLRNMLT